MNFIEGLIGRLYDFFSSDPIRLLTVIGGSGGAFYWWDRYKNRPKLLGEIEKERSYDDGRQRLNFEVENCGSYLTSLKREFIVKGYTWKRDKKRFIFYVHEDDRSLPPSAPKKFSAWTTDPDSVYDFLWFRTYCFYPTKGKKLKIRIRSAFLDELSLFRFLVEVILFRFFYKVPKTRAKADKPGPPGPRI